MKKQMTYKVAAYTVRLVREGRTTEAEMRVCDSSGPAAAVLHQLLDDSAVERIMVLYLNGVNKIIGTEQVAQGGLHGAVVKTRDVFRGALMAGASAVILGHNHPSGDPKPSKEDIDLTHNAVAAGEILGVSLLDHIVVCPNGVHWSMYNHMQMEKKG